MLNCGWWPLAGYRARGNFSKDAAVKRLLKGSRPIESATAPYLVTTIVVFGDRDKGKLMMTSDPEKPRKQSPESIEYQPAQSEGPTNEPGSGEEVSERRNEETDAQSKEDSV